MSFKDDNYKCAKRKCGHIYKHDETKWVDGRGGCPKCGHGQFYIYKPKGTK